MNVQELHNKEVNDGMKSLKHILGRRNRVLNILVVGNGFDIAHHLPTKYSDFLDFIKAFRNPDDSEYASFIDALKAGNKWIYSEIDSLIKSNALIDYFLSVYEDRIEEGKKGWIDFESEISVIVQRFDQTRQFLEERVSSQDECIRINTKLSNYLVSILAPKTESSNAIATHLVLSYSLRSLDNQVMQILDDLNRMTRLLEVYLYEYVEKLDCDDRIFEIRNKSMDCVLSFNYTDTYKRLYDPQEKAEYCYIHGKAQKNTQEYCNLVLGIDEYLTDERKDIDNRYVWFKKFYQRIYKHTGSEYLNWIKKIEHTKNPSRRSTQPKAYIFIYGHSLDVTDKDILAKLILLDNTKTLIYHHDRDSLAKQINNLVKVIGEDKLIELTSGEDRRIFFLWSDPALIYPSSSGNNDDK